MSLELFLFCFFSSLILIIFVCFPNFSKSVVKIFYAGEKGNFVFFISIVCLFLLFIRLSVRLRYQIKRNEQVIRKLALSELNINMSIGTQPKSRHNVLVKIAAYNEAKNISDVLKAMPDNVDLLIIDDGSRDNTAAISSSFGALTCRHAVNLGQGAADITGFHYAFEHEYDYVIEMDADGQHDPHEIPLFIEYLDNNPRADVVTGSRILGSAHFDNPRLRTFFLPYYTKLINHLTGLKLTDALCGYKAFRMKSLEPHRDIFYQIIEPQYLAAELYIRLANRKLSVDEIPVHINSRQYGTSHKGTLVYGVRVLRIILWTWLAELLHLNLKRK